MHEVLSCCSGKGGVGKTVLAANLGIALSDFDKKVLLLDLDLGMSNLDILLGEEDRVSYHLLDVLEGNCKIIEALVRNKEYPNLYLLPASKTRGFSALPKEQFRKLMAVLRKEFDYVIIDTPTGIGEGFQCAMEVSDRMLVLTCPDRLSIRLSKRVKEAMPAELLKNSALIINRLRIDLLRENAVMDPGKVLEEIGLPLLGVILEDDDILLGAGNGEDVIGINSVACRAFSNIARRLLGENIPIVLKGKR